MNAYQQRQKLHQLANADRTKERQQAKAMHVNSIITEFEKAYMEANKQEVEVKYERGWYYTRAKHGALGFDRHRERDLIEYIRNLWARVADAERRASMEHPEYLDA